MVAPRAMEMMMTNTLKASDWDSFVNGLMNEALPLAVRPDAPKRPTPKLLPNGQTRATPVKMTTAEVETAKARFERENADVVRAMREAASWSSFARSLVSELDNRYNRFGWSEKQLAAARSMAAKVSANADRRAASAPAKVEADLGRVRELFATAKAKGLGKPVFRAEGLTLSLAPAHGANPDAIYVKRDGEYAGKVVGTMFVPMRGFEGVAEALRAVALDPMAAAIRHGQLEGQCSCCGRKLTNTLSVELGIGPICRENWGL